MWRKRNGGIVNIEQYVLSKHNKTVFQFLTDDTIYEIKKVEEACRFIKKYHKEEKIFYLITDYDVDGVCAMAVLKIGLERFGCKVICRIPKRQSEGYGIRESIIDEIPPNAVLITADNGISEYNSLKKAKDKNIPCLVTDHHLPPVGNKPPVDVIVNPRIYKGTFEHYCGAAIVYKIMEKLLPEGDVVLPLLKAYATIATIADRMPLIEENRIIVKDGLEILSGKKGKITTGLQAIMEVMSMPKEITADNIAFQIAPLLNAPGRLEDDGAIKSLKTIVFNGPKETAILMAEELKSINEKRKELVSECMGKICLTDEVTYPVIIYQENIPEGIIGLIAAKLQEKYRGPAFVFTNSEDGKLKGSVRSNEIHVKNLLDQCKDLFVSYGGHEGAAGMTILAENLEALSKEMTEILKDFVPDYNDYYDLEIRIQELTNTLNELEKLKPFGYGNEMPVFKISNIPVIENYKLMGEQKKHLKILSDNASILCFNQAEEFLKYKNKETETETEVPISLDFLGNLEYNHFNGKSYAQMNATKMQIHREKEGTLLEKMKRRKQA